MKLTILAVCCAMLFGCIEPPKPTKTVTSAITINLNGCPENLASVDIKRNDKVRWTLDQASPGYPAVEAFSVAFDDYNPSYCVDEALVTKSEDVTCTIKADAKREPICYSVSTRSNGGQQTCKKRFILRVASNLPHSCAEP